MHCMYTEADKSLANTQAISWKEFLARETNHCSFDAKARLYTNNYCFTPC